MLAKGFSQPTQRVEKLKRMILDATPYVESKRAVLVTESLKETEGPLATLRRTKVVEKIFNQLPITIRDGEPVVGVITKNPRPTEICPEFSYDWAEKEFETMGTRIADPFQIPKETAVELHEAFQYWRGKATSALANPYMSQEAKDVIAVGVFTVGNYFYGRAGHACAGHGKVMRISFRGIIIEVVEAMEKIDRTDPEYVRKEQFYKSVIISYNVAIRFAHRYAEKARELAATEQNPTRKAELLQIARSCERVPEYGATNFYETCQAFWFVQMMLQTESSGHSISPGRFDQYMYPFYAANKDITPEFAQELVDCIWIKLSDVNKARGETSAQAFAGYVVFQNLGVGGQSEEGLDATGDVSYMAMEACAHIRLPAPSFSIRVWQGTPDEFLYRACELARLGMGVPAMYNDEVIIPAPVNRGVTLRDARNYYIIDCVEPQCPHKTEGWYDAAFFNVAKVLEIALNNGKARGEQLGPVTGEMISWKSMDDFFAAFKKQMSYFVHYLVEADNCIDIAHRKRAPLPSLSALVEDCISRGKSLQKGGAIYNFTGLQAFGVADTGDSVYAIQKHVFEDKGVTIDQLKEALDANFGYPVSASPAAPTGSASQEIELKVYEAVRRILGNASSINLTDIQKRISAMDFSKSVGDPGKYDHLRRLLDSMPSFGDDDDDADMIARKCAQIYCFEVEKYCNPCGSQFQADVYPVSANVLFGKDVAALPDGRLAKHPLADGVSPRSGKDCKGLTAASNSVAKLDHFVASNGTLYNQKFLPSVVAGDNGLKDFASVVRSYSDHKGMHVQFDIIDKETLLAAQENPENYRDLVVCVAGYSVQFVVLIKEVQDDIINRTAHTF